MSSFVHTTQNEKESSGWRSDTSGNLPDLAEAESVLLDLAQVFFASATDQGIGPHSVTGDVRDETADAQAPNLEAKYRALLEQIPAVVFMAYLDRGISEAYLSPQIEAALGYSREEWLEDPVRWYEHIHPEDKQRWSLEAAEMFLSGKPLRSAYRVIARDGRVIWFQCDARMMRREDGRPWFIHGVAFDISDLKRIEEERQEERNFISAILDTVGALVVVLDDEGHILRFNPACELTSGYSKEEVQGSISGICSRCRKRLNDSSPFSKCSVRIFCLRIIRRPGSPAMEMSG
jgi:PAS domain S-box-containing protein